MQNESFRHICSVLFSHLDLGGVTVRGLWKILMRKSSWKCKIGGQKLDFENYTLGSSKTEKDKQCRFTMHGRNRKPLGRCFSNKEDEASHEGLLAKSCQLCSHDVKLLQPCESEGCVWPCWPWLCQGARPPPYSPRWPAFGCNVTGSPADGVNPLEKCRGSPGSWWLHPQCGLHVSTHTCKLPVTSTSMSTKIFISL